MVLAACTQHTYYSTSLEHNSVWKQHVTLTTSFARGFFLTIRPIEYPDSVVGAMHDGLKQPGCKMAPVTPVPRVLNFLPAARVNSTYEQHATARTKRRVQTESPLRKDQLRYFIYTAQ